MGDLKMTSIQENQLFKHYQHIDKEKYAALYTTMNHFRREFETNHGRGEGQFWELNQQPALFEEDEPIQDMFTHWRPAYESIFRGPALNYRFNSKIWNLQKEQLQEKDITIRVHDDHVFLCKSQPFDPLFDHKIRVVDRPNRLLAPILVKALDEAYETIQWDKLISYLSYSLDQNWEYYVERTGIRELIGTISTHPMHPILYSWLLGVDVAFGAPELAIFAPTDLDLQPEEFVQTVLPNMTELEQEWQYQASMAKMLKKRAKREKRKMSKYTNSKLNVAAKRSIVFPSFNVELARRKNLVTDDVMKSLFDCLDNDQQALIANPDHYTLSEALQLFAYLDEERLKRPCIDKCSGAYGDICHLLRQNYRVVFKRGRTHEVAKNYEDMWELALKNHYLDNRHHPEYFACVREEIQNRGGHTRKSEPEDTLETLFDLLASAMRISDNAFEAFQKVKEWLFSWDKDPDDQYNWNQLAVPKPKFAGLSPLGTVYFLSRIIKRGLSTESCRKIQYNVERKAQCTGGEDKLPILALYNKIMEGKTNHKDKNMFLNWLKLPKFRAYIRETEWHVTLVDNMMHSTDLVCAHDRDKFRWDMILAYVYKWFIMPTLTNKNVSDFKHDQQKIDPIVSNLIPEMKKAVLDLVASPPYGVDLSKETIEGTSENHSFKDKVTSAISKASGIVLSPLSEPIDKACDAIRNLVNKLEGLVDTVIEKIGGFIKKITGLTFIKEYVKFSDITLLLIDYLIFVNTDSTMLKIATLMHALSVLGILQKVKELLEYFFLKLGKEEAPPVSSDTIEGTSETPIWEKLVTTITDCDPKKAGFVATLFIGLLLGVKAMKNVKAFELSAKVVEMMKDMHFVGAGLFGAERVFKYLVSTFKVALDWIRKRIMGETLDEKAQQERLELEKEMCQNLAQIDFYASQEGVNAMRSSIVAKQRATVVLQNAIKFLALARADKLIRDHKTLYFRSEKKINELHNIITRLNNATAFRKTPFHVQLYGQPGIGKSKLMRAIMYDVWSTYHSQYSEFNQCIYQPNFDKKHWDGYHGQKILMIDDAFQLLDPEVLMQMVLIVNTIPMLLPMANLTDKEETLQAEDIISSTNNPYPQVEKIAQMDAIHRRRHLLVEVEGDPDVMDETSCKFDLVKYYTKYMKFEPKAERMSNDTKKKFVKAFINAINSNVIVDFQKQTEEQLTSWIDIQAEALADIGIQYMVDIKAQLRCFITASILKDTHFPHLRFNLMRPVLGETNSQYYPDIETELPNGVKLPTRGMTYLEFMTTFHSRRKAMRKEEIDAYTLRDKSDHHFEAHDHLHSLLDQNEFNSLPEWIKKNIYDPMEVLADELHEGEDPFYFQLPEDELNYTKEGLFKNSIYKQNQELLEEISNIYAPSDSSYVINDNGTRITINLTQRKVRVNNIIRNMTKRDLDLLLEQKMITQDAYDCQKTLVGTSSGIQCSHCEPFELNIGQSHLRCDVCGHLLCSECLNETSLDFDKQMRERCVHTHVCTLPENVRVCNASADYECVTCSLPVCEEHMNERCIKHQRREGNTLPASIRNRYVRTYLDSRHRMDTLIRKAGSIDRAKTKFKAAFEKLEGFVQLAFEEQIESITATEVPLGNEFFEMYHQDPEKYTQMMSDPRSFGSPVPIHLFPTAHRVNTIFYINGVKHTEELNTPSFNANELFPTTTLNFITLLEREMQLNIWKDFMKQKNNKPWYRSVFEKFNCTRLGDRIFAPCTCHGNIGSTLPIDLRFLDKVRKINGKWFYDYDVNDWKWNLSYYLHDIRERPQNAIPHPMYGYSKELWWFTSYDFFMNELNEEQRDYLIKTLKDRNRAYNKALRLFSAMKGIVQSWFFRMPMIWAAHLKYLWEHPNFIDMRSVFMTIILTFGLISSIVQLGNLFRGRKKVEQTSRVMFKNKGKTTIIGTSINSENLLMGVRNNLVQIRYDGDYANGIGLDGHLLMVNKHVFKELPPQFEIEVQFTNKSEDFFPYLVKREDVHDIPNTDLYVFFVPTISPFKKIIHKFRFKDDYEKHYVRNLSLTYRKFGTIYCKDFAPQEIISKFMRETLSGKKVIGTNVLCYQGDPERGSSGGLITTDDQYCPRNILGVQCFRATDGRYGYANLVYQEQLQSIFDKYNHRNIVHDGPYQCLEGTSTQCEQVINTQITVEGKVPDEKIVGQIYRSSYEKTPISQYFTSTRIPAIINPFDSRVPPGEHPLAHSINKVGRDIMKPLDQELLDHCTQQYAMWLKTKIDPRYLTFEETLKGLVGDGSDKVNTKSSPGIPWVYSRTKPGKKDWIEFDEEGNVILLKKEIEDRFIEYEQLLQKGRVPPHSAYEFPKDELRPIAKALGPPIKTRSITVLDMIMNLVWRKYTLSFDAQQHQLADGNAPHCVGINPESLDWTRLYLALKVKSDYGCDLDIGNWDGHFTQQLALACTEIYATVYEDKGMEADRVRKSIVDLVFGGWFQFGDMVGQKHRGLESGFAGTAEMNTLAHVLVVFYFFCKIIKKHYKILPTWTNFQAYTTVRCYGDDIILSVSDEIKDVFNPESLAREYEYYGWPATSADKTKPELTWRKIEELTFLKRSFVRTTLGGQSVVFGALDRGVIEDLRYWIRRSSDMREQLYINLNLALEYAFMHGKTYFQKLLEEVNEALTKAGLDPLYATFETIKTRLIARFIEEEEARGFELTHDTLSAYDGP